MGRPYKSPVVHQEFLHAFNVAWKQKGLTHAQVCGLAEMHQNDIRNWATGRYRPRSRQKLERLAEVLDAHKLPRLLDPHKPEKVVVSCPNPEGRSDCKGARYYRPGHLKYQLKTKPGNSADIDWQAGVGTYLCGVCAPKVNGQNNFAAFRRDMSQHYVSKEDGLEMPESKAILQGILQAVHVFADRRIELEFR